MQEKLNKWSFAASIVWTGMFLIVSFTSLIEPSASGFNIFSMLLFLSLFTFLASVIGLAGIRNWKGLARSVATIFITVGLSVFLSVILFYGRLLASYNLID